MFCFFVASYGACSCHFKLNFTILNCYDSESRQIIDDQLFQSFKTFMNTSNFDEPNFLSHALILRGGCYLQEQGGEPIHDIIYYPTTLLLYYLYTV